uniref:Uncharacterized protein n=1 Tax=Setaria viridis TaxID=4556 RepID=A0A4U6W6R9_SETVI|nr:hypothetical protein SEVIR_1G095600v2 [Setaria viridis]
MPVVEIWRRRASPCGRFDGRDRVNDARIEGAQVKRHAAAGARASAEQQIVGRLLTGRRKRSCRCRGRGWRRRNRRVAKTRRHDCVRSDGKDGRHWALRPGSSGVMMGAGGEAPQKVLPPWPLASPTAGTSSPWPPPDLPPRSERTQPRQGKIAPPPPS